MSIAQLFFDGAPLNQAAQPELGAAWDYGKKSLSYGFEINHSSPQHKCLAEFHAFDAKSSASRLSVDLKDFNSLQHLGGTYLLEALKIRFPAEKIWVELPHEIYAGDDESSMLLSRRAGVLISESVEEENQWNVDIYVDAGYNMAIPYVGGFIKRPDNETITGGASYHINRVTKDMRHHEAVEDLVKIGFDALLIIAALNIPRVTERRPVVWQQPLQKARLKRGRHPLLSFNKVAINLPKSSLVGGDTMRREVGGGVRFHSVLGHLRRLERPHGVDVTWVSPHWRGDARLGVVVKERALKAGR